MDTPQYTSTPMDELRRIEAQVHQATTVDELRALFARLQMLRRAFVDDFDLQLAIGSVQQTIVDRGRMLLEGPNGRLPAPAPSFASPLEEQTYTPTPEEPAAFDYPAPPAAPWQPDQPETPLPPGVQRLDAKSWRRSIYIGAFFAVVLFAVFFYLIQMARKLNFAPAQQAQNAVATQTGKANVLPTAATTPAAPAGPALRLFTDLVPGTVSVDGAAPAELQDGQLQMDVLTPGHHTVRVSGHTGDAAFDFDVGKTGAPRLAAPPTGNNALVVAVSVQGGTGQIMSNAPVAEAVIDTNPAAAIPPGGLTLNNLGTVDHNLEIRRPVDQQRFVLTYTAAPALTVFVKSDPNAGSLLVVAGEDGASVLLNDKPYRRPTDHGELRIPSLRVGSYVVKLVKPGFLDAPAQTVQVEKGAEARLQFHLVPAPQFAALQIRGAQPGTGVVIDRELAVTAGPDGSASVNKVKPGDHAIELRRDGYVTRILSRPFKAGEAVTLGASDVALEKIPPQIVAQPAPPPPPVPPAQPQSVTMPAAIHKGGGFLVYHTPNGPGHYTFTAQLRKGGGFLKAKRIEWFVDYRDDKNYLLFQVDGKHFTVREVTNGKSRELQRVPFEGDPSEYLEVDLSLKQGSVETRLKPSDGSWRDLGPVPVSNADPTRGQFGFLVPGGEEVGVSTVRFSK